MSKFVNADGEGRIRAAWLQAETSNTNGRLYSNNPNLHTVPLDFVLEFRKASMIVGKDDRVDSRIISARAAFKARPGFSFVAADYAQIELRLLAHLSGDASLLQLVNDVNDPFEALAAGWRTQLTEPPTRQQAKRIAYAVIYGIGPEALGVTLEIKTSAAKQLLNEFMKKFERVGPFQRSTIASCCQNGFVTSLLKRIRTFPDINTTSNSQARKHMERAACNFVVQGSAADIIKVAMCKVDQATRKHENLELSKSYFVLQIHDELIYEVKDIYVAAFCAMIKQVILS